MGSSRSRTRRAKADEIYDLCWSPCGNYIVAGGTDNAARIYRVDDGAAPLALRYLYLWLLPADVCATSDPVPAGVCVAELTDHKNWVQGVAWDPLGKFIATQGKDRCGLSLSLVAG